MAEFAINTINLRECGKDIINLSNELNDVFNALYTRINNMPTNTGEWTGNAAKEFVRELNIERKYYNVFKSNLCSYGKLLVNVSDKLETDVKKVGL